MGEDSAIDSSAHSSASAPAGCSRNRWPSDFRLRAAVARPLRLHNVSLGLPFVDFAAAAADSPRSEVNASSAPITQASKQWSRGPALRAIYAYRRRPASFKARHARQLWRDYALKRRIVMKASCLTMPRCARLVAAHVER